MKRSTLDLLYKVYRQHASVAGSELLEKQKRVNEALGQEKNLQAEIKETRTHLSDEPSNIKSNIYLEGLLERTAEVKAKKKILEKGALTSREAYKEAFYKRKKIELLMQKKYPRG